MSLLREVMAESMGVVIDVLGGPCVLTNSVTLEPQSLTAIVRSEVEVYENGVFVGTATTVVFNKSVAAPKIGDLLSDTDTGISYTLSGVKAETPTKIEFYLRPD